MPQRRDVRSDGLLSYRESATSVELVLHKPTARYIDQLLTLRCASDLLRLRLFPEAKEVTETFAAVRALFMYSELRRNDGNVHAIAVGDGGRPRTAATMAFRTRWTCHSVDPQLAGEWSEIDRLHVQACRIEDARWRIPPTARVLVVAVHAHVELADTLAALAGAGITAETAVALPCCGFRHDAPGLRLVADYEDWGIWSEHRRVRVYSQEGTGS